MVVWQSEGVWWCDSDRQRVRVCVGVTVSESKGMW